MATDIVPSVGNAPSFTQGGVGASPGYDAIDRRRAYSPMFREGVLDATAWKASEASPNAMSVVIAAAVAGAYVQGDSVADQGLYYCPPHTADITEAIATADVSNPRIDRVVLQVQDDTHDGSGNNRVFTSIVAGTPTAGATLDNESGAATIPDTAMHIADVIVGAGVTSITNADIRDHRPYGRREAQVGDGKLVFGSTAGDGWLLCQGQSLKRNQHAELFNFLNADSLAYGTGDGSTTFTLPDCRGRIPVGVDGAAGRMPDNDALGASGGEAKHTLTSGESGMPTHGHSDTFAVASAQPWGASLNAPLTNGSWQSQSASLGAGFTAPQANGAGGVTYASGSHSHSLTGGVSNASGVSASSSHENRQPYLVANWAIFTGTVAS